MAAAGDILFSGDLEKWANTARGETWRKFNITLTSKEMRWHRTGEDNNNSVFLGVIEVSRIVNVKIDHKCARKETGYSVFIVEDPNKKHEFRSKCTNNAEEWVQNIKNATLPKTRRKKDPNVDINRDRIQSGISTNDKTGYVTEVLGGIHIERQSETCDNSHNNNNFLISSGLEPFSNNRRVSDSDTDISEVPTNEGEESDCIIREGYLIKQGHTVKNWKRRWFTLSRYLLAYRDEEGTVLKGQIHISDIILARVSSKYPEKRFLFEVITKKRTYYMEASSQEEMDSWTDALSNILIKTFHNSDASSLNSC